MEQQESNKRIAKNTVFLYIRMLFNLAVNLYASRVVLGVLGIEDYGIYNVVGGFVALFSLISSSLSASSARFLTFELAKGNRQRLEKIFAAAVSIQLLLALLVLIMAFTAGDWFLNTRMNIPDTRMEAANRVFHFSILTFALNLLSAPYNAVLIAHERMKAFAAISILESLLKLGAVILLPYLCFDHLKSYAGLLLLSTLLILLVYVVYARKCFEECRCRFRFDSSLLRQMFHFAGWNLIGSSAAVLRDQGVNILLNLFCGPAVNAARGIAFQVMIALQGFSGNLMAAINPQITKTYATKEREYMLFLIRQGARWSFYLLLLLSLPLLLETKYILHLWLKQVPEHTVAFVRLILLFILVESLSAPLITAMLATGNIKKFQLVVGGLQLLNFPASYCCLQSGLPPESTLFVALLFSQLCLLARLLLLKEMIAFPVGDYLRLVLLKVFLVFFLSMLLPGIFYFLMPEGIVRFLSVLVISSTTTALSVYCAGCSGKEQEFIRQKVTFYYKRLINRSGYE